MRMPEGCMREALCNRRLQLFQMCRFIALSEHTQWSFVQTCAPASRDDTCHETKGAGAATVDRVGPDRRDRGGNSLARARQTVSVFASTTPASSRKRGRLLRMASASMELGDSSATRHKSCSKWFCTMSRSAPDLS